MAHVFVTRNKKTQIGLMIQTVRNLKIDGRVCVSSIVSFKSRANKGCLKRSLWDSLEVVLPLGHFRAFRLFMVRFVVSFTVYCGWGWKNSRWPSLHFSETQSPSKSEPLVVVVLYNSLLQYHRHTNAYRKRVHEYRCPRHERMPCEVLCLDKVIKSKKVILVF